MALWRTWAWLDLYMRNPAHTLVTYLPPPNFFLLQEQTMRVNVTNPLASAKGIQGISAFALGGLSPRSRGWRTLDHPYSTSLACLLPSKPLRLLPHDGTAEAWRTFAVRILSDLTSQGSVESSRRARRGPLASLCGLGSLPGLFILSDGWCHGHGCMGRFLIQLNR